MLESLNFFYISRSLNCKVGCSICNNKWLKALHQDLQVNGDLTGLDLPWWVDLPEDHLTPEWGLRDRWDPHRSVYQPLPFNTLFENHLICLLWIWHFPSIFAFDRKLQVFQNSPKLTIFGIFTELLSTQNVNVARFARNFQWDFFCDFQTLCVWLMCLGKRSSKMPAEILMKIRN